MISFNSGLKT